MYTDTVQKLPSNPESNIMRCSTVPRFKYLPTSAPALSSRGTPKASIPAASDDISLRSSWKAYTNGELSQKIDLDDNSSFGVAAPILKSFMQVECERRAAVVGPVNRLQLEIVIEGSKSGKKVILATQSTDTRIGGWQQVWREHPKVGIHINDGQVGIFKDRSAAAKSTFGDILPAQAAGLLSSFTATRSDS
ncbi:hypothetical protein GH714_000256 [Hevea brasiliensis]|uniref:Conserved oligomeric Golgi complex subunit 1 n=1 Tax=Hevea brasiliensis TaxID=3981 RepID=A0A6A6KVG7_HEVBR|nr:hypothetical protein GH714_000256 [Hevea brasiliensis]